MLATLSATRRAHTAARLPSSSPIDPYIQMLNNVFAFFVSTFVQPIDG
jgi:hypothetical protein